MMDKEKIVEILKKADCLEPPDCLFNLFDFDEKYNPICKATDPPKDAYNGEGCPFCEMLAQMLEKAGEA